MTTSEQRPVAPHRFSSGILSRMLQMEKESLEKSKDKKSKQHRVPVARSTSAHAAVPDTSTGSGVHGTPMSPRTALTSHPPSSLMRRPPTAPSLSVNTQTLDPERSRDSGMGEGNGDAPPEICLSPSWSDFGGSKKRKEKKRLGREKKEQEKKKKSESEESRAADNWVGKRLSKKPPAAMDTQKMPSALRRNSATSFLSSYPSSQEDSRRSSREEGRPRLSIGSRGNNRSRSTPNTSSELPSDSPASGSHIVSAAPPQLPKLHGFGWHSRKSSTSSNRTSGGGGGAHDKDLGQFAYCLEASSSAKNPGNFILNYSENSATSSQRSRPLQLEPPPFSRSRTAPNILGAEEGRTAGMDAQRPPLIQRDSQNGNVPDRLSSGHGRHQRLITAGKENDDEARMQPTGKFMSDEFLQISRLHASGSGPGVQPSQVKAHNDGSSYVHKQRMNRQKESIEGYRVELAVEHANKEVTGDDFQAGEGPSTASTRSASSESSKQRTPQTSIDSEGRAEERATVQEQPNQYQAYSKDARNSVPPGPTQAPQGSRADKILSFRPFQRKGKPPKTPTTTKPILPVATPSPKSPQSLLSSLTPRAVASPQKSSKAERSHGEPASPQVDKSLPNSPEGTPKDAAKEHIPQRPAGQTRPSSSEQSNEDNLVSRAFARSSTAPVLSTMARQIAPIPNPVDVNVANEDQRQPEVGSPKRNAPRGPRSPPADIKTLPKLPPEIIIEGVNGEGLVHKTSIKRPRSNPNLLTTAAAPGMPSLDFLPQLKHQPLTKPKRTSPILPSFTSSPDRVSFPASSRFPVPAAPTLQSTSDSNLPSSTSPPDLKLMPKSPLRPTVATAATSDTALLRPANARRRTMGPLTFGNGDVAGGLDAKPVAKLFVICCKCKFWHDLPSHLYELMAMPRKLSRRDSDEAGAGSSSAGAKEGRLDTMVQCPWCQHPMTTWCCAGWTTVVYLHERHH